MRLTGRQLVLAALDRQLLLERRPLDVVTAVRRVVALQAQEPASPYLALWNRVADFDFHDLDDAFTQRRLVKSSLMRITLHAVPAQDYPIFHAAMVSSLRASRLLDRRFVSAGLTIPEMDALLPELAEFLAQPRPSADIVAMLEQRLGEHGQRAWWALRTFAPVHRAPTGGPWSFGGNPAFVAAAQGDPQDAQEALAQLLLRYLRAFGPASARDFARFTMLRSPVITAAFRVLGEQVRPLTGPDGATVYDIAEGAIPAADIVVPPRLLPMWDSILLGYDRSRVLPEQYRPLVIRRNGDVLPCLLVDGRVVGVWRPLDGGVELTAFETIDADSRKGLTGEAEQLSAAVADRDPVMYKRYTHWWDKGFPGAKVSMVRG